MYHILGLHKLKDVNEFINTRKQERKIDKVFNNVNDIKTQIIKSRYFCKIIKRLNALLKLESILDNNLESYYSKNNYYHAMDRIDYDFVFHYRIDEFYYSFYFIKKGDNRYVMVSMFEDFIPKTIYINRPFTLLYKAKVFKDVNNDVGNKLILLNKIINV